MSGYYLKRLIDSKCVSCSYFLGCKIQEGFKELSTNEKVSQKDYDKLENCLFYRKL